MGSCTDHGLQKRLDSGHAIHHFIYAYLVNEMGKIYETKKDILKLLSSRAKTLTDISRELGLAPATVSQHLKELRNAGAIEQVDNPYIRKWKYYIVASRAAMESRDYGNQMNARAPMSGFGGRVVYS